MNIYKYKLNITDIQQVEMPIGAKILSAQFQGEDLVMWAIVNVTLPKELRSIHIFGTGNPMYGYKESFEFIATVQQYSYGLVWHIFEAK